MKIDVNGQKYYIDDAQLIDWIKGRIQPVFGKKIKLPKGPTIDLSKKSITSTLIRQLFVFIVPVLEWIAASQGIALPKKERHGDIIQHTMDCYFLIVKDTCKDLEIITHDAPYVDEIRIINSATLTKENSSAPFPFFPLIINESER